SVANPVDQTEHNPMFFRNQIHDLSALPPPDFRSYFASLRQACESQSVYEGLLDHVALSIEGTRGCFAKCDFCSLNRNWSGFRKRTGETVAKETLALRRAYPAGKVYFTDNVCDTWAEDYADALIAGGQRVRSHMQLRAHHPPSFWIKLALSGVEVVQIGVEALSAPLLSVISKGTKPVQNVRSLKLLAELGINCTDASNIITHHPRSTLADVAETRRVLEAILHFGTFSMVPFALVPGAPIYEELSREEKDQLRIDPRVPLPGALSSYLVEKHMTKPTHWRDPERDEAWDAVVTWYFAEKAKETGGSGLRLLESTPEQVWLQGYQAGRFTEIVLDGLDAAIVDACHEGPSTEQLAGTLGLTTAELMPMLDGLAELGILLAIGGHYLTVALRSRDTVLLRYFRETGPVGRDDGALPDAGAIIPPFHPELTPAEAGKGRR
ncbi:MAG: radical SAM protein, partial [Paracoccaceae bacterium]|nr:radical SAM protein [Paracoccaceae bacterium]